MSSEFQPQLQRTLGDAYTLERELGGGGMSRVFLALERALGRKVVVKVLLPELAAGVSVERFRREIQLAAQLQHPHIVPLLSAGEADGLPYFIMPFVVGESLRSRIAREGELPITETVRILRDVVSALAYAHSRGVVHRDIKPDNVLLTGGVAVVTDFGVAKAVSASSELLSAGAFTSLGVALGTPAYMAPEQATASPQTDHRADIYALGVMAYEMLAGMPPFVGRTPQAILAAHVVEQPEPIERRRPSVPPMLATLVRECLAKRPADRPQAASDVMQLIDAIITPSSGTAPTSAVMTPAAPTVAIGRRRWPVAAALVGLAVAAAGVLWIRSASRTLPSSSTEQPSAAIPQASGGDGHVSAGVAPPSAEPAPASPGVPQSATSPPRDSAGSALPAPRAAGPGAAPRAQRQPQEVRRSPARRPVRDSVARRETAATQPPAPAVQESLALGTLSPAPTPLQRHDSAAPAPDQVRAVPSPTPPVAAADTAAPTPSPAPKPAPAAPAPAPSAADARQEIGRVLAEYARAIEAESLTDLQRIYPGMTPAQRRGWEQFFQLVEDVKAQLSVTHLDIANGTADAQVVGSYAYRNTSTGRSERQPLAFRAGLKREGDRWLISQVR